MKIEEIFTSKVRVKILKYLVEQEKEIFTLAEIKAYSRSNHTTVKGILNSFKENGVIEEILVGQKTMFRLSAKRREELAYIFTEMEGF